MIEPVRDISTAFLERYDDIVDVRSPAEFAEDRLPRAINLPVLSNEERAEVGTIYVQQSRFLARRVGAAIVSRNIARHLETALQNKPAKWRPLIYCWRGGMRSNAMATVLSQIGWRVGVLDGGYKTWRRKVVAELYDSDAPLKLLLIDGSTGSAKSEILRRAIQAGAAGLDLEGAARHRGSVFGAMDAAGQPGQRHFESQLFDSLSRIDPARTILVEAESSEIGRVVIPRRLWRLMTAAPHVVISAPIEARADYLLTAYRDFFERDGAVAAAIARLRPFHAREKIDAWLAFAAAGDWRRLAIELMRDHYDPLYARAATRRSGAPIARISLPDLQGRSLEKAVEGLKMLLDGAGLPRVMEPP
jgi:tRNA 2-selenouridine synthase